MKSAGRKLILLPCVIEGCDNVYFSSGFCLSHYRQKQRDDGYYYKYRASQKFKLMNILGGAKCVKCGFDDIRALQFDHITGNKTENHSMTWNYMIADYIRNPDKAKIELQVLCANCNWIKRFENHEHNRYTRTN